MARIVQTTSHFWLGRPCGKHALHYLRLAIRLFSCSWGSSEVSLFCGSPSGVALLPSSHLTISGDILSQLVEMGLLLVGGGERSGMRLNVLQCKGQLFTTRRDLTPDVSTTFLYDLFWLLSLVLMDKERKRSMPRLFLVIKRCILPPPTKFPLKFNLGTTFLFHKWFPTFAKARGTCSLL